MRLAGQCALITGAGSGIGRETALMFAREGAQIGVADIDPESAAKVMGEIRDQGGSARPIILDVADSAAVAKAYSELLAAFGQIDISVHYAGLRQTWPAITYDETLPKNAQITDEFWAGMIASHLSGSFYCSREALKVMIPRGRGRIINCGSAVAHASFSSSAAYVAAKLGIVGLTRALAVEAAPYGVLVNCVAPGAIDTPRPGIGRLPKDILDVAVAKTPARRWAHPREVASVALFLASEDASYMVGQVLSPNGGAAMGI